MSNLDSTCGLLTGEVDLDTEPACITWSRWNDLPSQIMSFVWIKG